MYSIHINFARRARMEQKSEETDLKDPETALKELMERVELGDEEDEQNWYSDSNNFLLLYLYSLKPLFTAPFSFPLQLQNYQGLLVCLKFLPQIIVSWVGKSM